MVRWYAVRTQPNQEARAEHQLQRQGFATFLPRIGKSVRHARKLRQVRAPLFPGYLFVQLDLTRDRWRAVNSTYGVFDSDHGRRAADAGAGGDRGGVHWPDPD